MKNLLNDYIFPSFLTSAEVENLNNNSIVEECYMLRDDDPQGVHKSNVYGWHSKVQSGICVYENLNNLSQQALEFANEVLKFHKLNQKISKMTWWVNINPEYTYNAIHSHPKADLSVVYYAQIKKESGSLVLLRNDGAMHTSLYDKQPFSLRYSISPEVGRLYAFPAHLLHQVLNNLSDEDRISIAFNMSI